MIRILHTADLHLEAPFPGLGGRAGQRQEDFFKTFDRLLTLAIKNEVHLFVVSGDLFDHPRPNASTVGRVQAGLKRLADRGIVPVLLPGTHDATVASDSVFRRTTFPGIVLMQPTVEQPVRVDVTGQALFLYGFAYRSSASAEALASMKRREGEGLHLGLLHGSRQGSPEWEYRKKDLPFTLPALKAWDLDYVALGHYHGFETLEEGGRIFACYPGSPEGKRFGENGARYAALVSLQPGSVRVEKIAVNARVLEERQLDLSGCENEEKAAEAICALGQPDLLLRLELTGIVEVPLRLEALQARCAESFFHLEFVDRTRLFDSDFARRIGQEETVRGVFVRKTRQLMEEVPEERRAVVEDALREVLVRFHAFDGGGQ